MLPLSTHVRLWVARASCWHYLWTRNWRAPCVWKVPSALRESDSAREKRPGSLGHFRRSMCEGKRIVLKMLNWQVTKATWSNRVEAVSHVFYIDFSCFFDFLFDFWWHNSYKSLYSGLIHFSIGISTNTHYDYCCLLVIVYCCIDSCKF